MISEYLSDLYSISVMKFPILRKNQKLQDAFFQLPRHRFIKSICLDDLNWIHVNKDNLSSLLPRLYYDAPILLYAQQDFICTISQPSLVLKMIDMLNIQPGDKIFELGAGSGWNAALMGYMTGKEGKVISYEIIPEMAHEAQENVKQFSLPQVEIRQGDALDEKIIHETFDRGVFTAGAVELPIFFFNRIEEKGKLLFVWKTLGADLLLSLEKNQDQFIIQDILECSFVPVTGLYESESLEYISTHEVRKGMVFKIIEGKSILSN